MHSQLTSVNIELTSRCNLHCKMCYRNHMYNEEGDMDRGLFDKILRDLKSVDTLEEVYLHWRGEPSLFPFLPEAIKKIKQEVNKKVIMFTNGTILNADVLEKIMKAGLDSINFSLEADTNEAYENIRGANCLDIVKKNIRLANQIRKEHQYKTKLFIYGVVLEDNMFELLKVKQEFENVVNEVLLKYDMRRESVTRGVMKDYCIWPFHNLLVSWNGEVAPCCIDVNHEYKIGNVRDHSIQDLFYGPEFSRLRTAIQEGSPTTICKQCGFNENNN